MPRSIRKIEPTKFTIPVRTRVAAYARVSSGKDASLHSLSAQISYYSDYIQKHRGWEYIGVYADEAVTGTVDGRAEFQRILTDCRDKKIDLILTKSISRFARNTVTMLEVVRELKDLGVDVYFERENIHSMSGDGELMLTILSSFAQEESRSVSENIKWRIRRRFADGEIVNLRFIFGYQVRKGCIEINPAEAEIVRMIFKDYINGMGCPSIAKKISDMDVSRPRGGIWNSDRIAEVIKNEKYTGNSLLQKKYVSDHLTKTLVRNKGQLPKYYAEETHPPIIDVETFELAREIMAKNRKRNSGKKESGSYPFTSRIVCGNCGKKFKRKTTHGRISWTCSTYLKYGKSSCSAKQIPEGILTEASASALGLTDFDEKIFSQQIKEIQVPADNQLTYIFYDGRTIIRDWTHRSRSLNWDEKARQKARDNQLEKMERRKHTCEQQQEQ